VPTVGVIANPAAGKDVRRLVAHAAPVADTTKVAILRRLFAGAIEGGADRLLLAPDRRALTERALQGLDLRSAAVSFLDLPLQGDRTDTVAAARALRDEADALVVLGGDGTCRDVAWGWPDAPLVAVSTGTNNVFPRAVEPTVAGLAAGLVAAGAMPTGAVTTPAKVLHLELPDAADLALVEVAVVAGNSVGSRAVWEPASLRAMVAVIAEPDAVGLSAVAAALHPCRREEPGAVVVCVGHGRTSVRVALLPGVFTTVERCDARPLPPGVPCSLRGPGVLALDGERTHVLGPEDTVTVTVGDDGPRVIDVRRTLAEAASRGRFRLEP